EKHSAGNTSKSSFDQFVKESNKAQTSNDGNWLKAHLSDAYVEGTSFGTWVSKAQLLKDAADPANNKYSKSDISEVQNQVVGNIGLARFKESYDAMIEGQHRARTIICSMVAEKGAGGWKALSTHCSKVE
ncbi:MAG TPA: nuclear transport factor 2 family protein, partial [Terriglobales bacterium]|nr:nuclear transport factor 2 family protein [Terriglobales bacterium]